MASTPLLLKATYPLDKLPIINSSYFCFSFEHLMGLTLLRELIEYVVGYKVV
jgi:hypothetical protein